MGVISVALRSCLSSLEAFWSSQAASYLGIGGNLATMNIVFDNPKEGF